MNRHSVFLLSLLLSCALFAQDNHPERTVTFRFIPGNDMFIVPLHNNETELQRLFAWVDEYWASILSGEVPIHVNGYSASQNGERKNLRLAKIRSNRVKSELITRKGMSEEHFVTTNHATAYTAPNGDTFRDMVVVTLRIPTPPRHADPPRHSARSEEPTVDESQSLAISTEDQEPGSFNNIQDDEITSRQSARSASSITLRTNLLYDAFLLPTLGIEWRINSQFGIKLDGSLSRWGGGHGYVQRNWLLSPELRWYMGERQQFYIGASGNIGKYNIYKGMLGHLFPDNTGYQGNLWSAGATVGYQLPLSPSFSLDFNLGLGCAQVKYDSFHVINETRIYKDMDKKKNYSGPIQAGISLVWKLK